MVDWIRSRRASRSPGVWRAEDTGLVASDNLFAKLCGSERPLSMRLFADGVSRPIEPKLRPVPDDQSLRGWFERLVDIFQTRETGVIVNNIQAHDHRLFHRGITLTDEVFRNCPLTGGGAGIDLILGSYQRGFFNLHKDDQDVVTFVVEGRKRFLAWPYEVFAHLAPTDRPIRTIRHNPGPIDYAAEAGRATVLEGEPGNLIFWPAEWWHVAEGDGSFSVTSPIGWLYGPRLRQHLQELWAQQLVDPVVTQDGWTEGRVAEALANPNLIDHAHRQLELAARAWTTAAGFNERPSPVEVAELLDDHRLGAACPNRWYLRREDDQLRCIALGRSLRLPAAPLVEQLMRALANGHTVVVGEWCARAVDDPDVEPETLRKLFRVLASYGLLSGTR